MKRLVISRDNCLKDLTQQGSQGRVAEVLAALKTLQFFDAEGLSLPGSYEGEAADNICKAAKVHKLSAPVLRPKMATVIEACRSI